MNRRVFASVVTLVLMALMNSLPAAAAEPEEAAPTGFTGWVHGLPQSNDEACAGRLDFVGGVEQTRDFRCKSWMGTSDPRFTGTYVTEANSDTYRDTEGALEDGQLVVSTVTHRVENDDGAWQTPPSVSASWMPDGDDVSWPEPTTPTETVIFTGEGAYEDLTAVVWLDSFVINPQIWGAIFAGEPPPTPSLAE
jgi:hypothetical protein